MTINEKLNNLKQKAANDAEKEDQLEKCLKAENYTKFITAAESFENAYGTDEQITIKKKSYNTKREKILKEINKLTKKDWKEQLDTKSDKYTTNLLQEEITAIDSLKIIITDNSLFHSNKRTTLQKSDYYDNAQKNFKFKNWGAVKDVQKTILDNNNIKLNNSKTLFQASLEVKQVNSPI